MIYLMWLFLLKMHNECVSCVSPFHACRMNQNEIVRHLAQQKADVEQGSDCNKAGPAGRQPVAAATSLRLGPAVHGKEQVIALDAEYMNHKHSWVRRAQTIRGFAISGCCILMVPTRQLMMGHICFDSVYPSPAQPQSVST